MAKSKRRKAGKKKSGNGLPGWLYMFFGLAIGLAVAAGIYVNDRREGIVAPVAAPVASAKTPSRTKAAKEKTEDDSIEFDFYSMLPNLDVEIFEGMLSTGRCRAGLGNVAEESAQCKGEAVQSLRPSCHH